VKSWHMLDNRKGTAAIEFAVLAPALLLLAFGIFEFGRYAWAVEAIQESASAGARCVGIGQSSCEASGTYSASATATYVTGVAAGWGLTIPTSDVTSNNSTSCGGVTGFSQVQISYVFSTVVSKLIPSLSSKTVTATSCFPNNATG